jgi:hypothetical protein
VNDDVAIGMSDDAARVRYAHSAEHDVLAGPECMDVETLADTHRVCLCASQNSGGRLEILRARHLDVER